MSSLNRIILIGRLTRDPELRYTPNGHPVASFTLAIDRPRQNAQGEREADFIDIVAWQKLAETCANYLGKGRLIAIEGRLQIRSYETNDGQKRKAAEVIASNMRILDRSPQQKGPDNGELVKAAATKGDYDDVNIDDIPF